jgi:hypothetical protein
MITTHSPFFVNGLKPQETWIIYRDESGYTRVQQASTIKGVRDFMAEGAQLGHLWMQGHFGVGDPLSPDRPKANRKAKRRSKQGRQ